MGRRRLDVRLDVVEISLWKPFDRDAVIDLIVGIQTDEFALDISAEDQPDLTDVEGFYRGAGGEFWVAREGSRVLGTIAVRPFEPRAAALRKLFVDGDYRGAQGTADQLMETLVAWSRDEGIDDLWLGTTSVMTRAQRFYGHRGFTEVERHALPAAFPVMAVDSVFFRRDLTLG